MADFWQKSKTAKMKWRFSSFVIMTSFYAKILDWHIPPLQERFPSGRCWHILCGSVVCGPIASTARRRVARRRALQCITCVPSIAISAFESCAFPVRVRLSAALGDRVAPSLATHGRFLARRPSSLFFLAHTLSCETTYIRNVGRVKSHYLLETGPTVSYLAAFELFGTKRERART